MPIWAFFFLQKFGFLFPKCAFVFGFLKKARVQTFKKIETNLNCSFLKIASLTVFSISFLLFIMFDIMLERYICLTRSSNFVIY